MRRADIKIRHWGGHRVSSTPFDTEQPAAKDAVKRAQTKPMKRVGAPLFHTI